MQIKSINNQNFKVKYFVSILLVLFFISNCGVSSFNTIYRTYPEAWLRFQDIAVIKKPKFESGLSLFKFDEKDVDFRKVIPTDLVAVLPGEHSLEFFYSKHTTSYNGNSRSSKTISFNKHEIIKNSFEAEHIYEIKYEINHSSASFQVQVVDITDTELSNKKILPALRKLIRF